ncbi:ATP-dependent Zn protease [Leptolyngbya sp. BL0902]|uniref:ATP-dependent Zn protease n=1 Tax=Leptolyngbya sp. BL0902 TaxID=1115757 RepID=UPI0018E7612A|nr:ATP-dependent Zn protease [Leptolyngbya sp. BL0902]QQE66968.1 ATP-dependent Zn protease [Leptolyngbya sp. BL0902]
MRDTTLNAIAVVIFGMTMASLLGPLIHLSPALVAGVAATGLGIFTVDQLNLQGRIGNLITDALAWFSPEHRQRVIHHEAGHLLTALLLDIPVQDYTLTTWEAWRRGLPGQGGVIFGLGDDMEHPLKDDLSHPSSADQPRDQPPIPLTPQWLDRYSQVWMAGLAAEQMIYGDALGGDGDVQALRQLWRGLGKSDLETTIKQRWATLQAKTLLETHRDTFDALVNAMTERASVAACRDLVQQARPTVAES